MTVRHETTVHEVEKYRLALEEIAGWFIKGQRNTYLPGDQVLDRIRATAEEALGRTPS